MFDMRNLASIRAIQESALCFQNAGNLKLLQGRRSSSGKRLSLKLRSLRQFLIGWGMIVRLRGLWQIFGLGWY